MLMNRKTKYSDDDQAKLLGWQVRLPGLERGRDILNDEIRRIRMALGMSTEGTGEGAIEEPPTHQAPSFVNGKAQEYAVAAPIKAFQQSVQSKVAKERWANLSPRKKKALQEKMQGARKKRMKERLAAARKTTALKPGSGKEFVLSYMKGHNGRVSMFELRQAKREEGWPITDSWYLTTGYSDLKDLTNMGLVTKTGPGTYQLTAKAEA